MFVHLSKLVVIVFVISVACAKSSSNQSRLNTFSECNGEVSDPGTQITSGNYPGPYMNSQDCWINIYFNEEEKVQLTFLDFDVHGKSSNHNAGCSFSGDYLELVDGFISLGKPYCNYNMPVLSTPIISVQNTLTIHFRTERSSKMTNGRGFKLTVEVAPKCICEHHNGDTSKNGILCGRSENFTKINACNRNSWCTGPSNKSEAVEYREKHENLCEMALVSCGEDALVPRCNLCLKNNDTTSNSWCSGDCYYSDDTKTCTDIYKRLSSAKQTKFMQYKGCTVFGTSYSELPHAKDICSSIGQCVGVAYTSNGYYLCNSIRMAKQKCIACQDVFEIYKKQRFTASPEEFIHLDKRTQCGKVNTKVLQHFSFPSLASDNATHALWNCKSYCSNINNCMGCSIDVTSSSQINAIAHCGKPENGNDSFIEFMAQKPVCMEINVNTEKESAVEWKIGLCHGTQKYFKETWYIERCCMPPGYHTLQCKTNGHHFGWSRAFIEFNGQKYCDDFMGLKAMRKVKLALDTKIIGHSSVMEENDEERLANLGTVPQRAEFTDGNHIKCPENTIDNLWGEICFCEDHCSWDVCRLQKPPEKCLSGTNSSWVWDYEKMHFTARKKSCIFVPVAPSHCPDDPSDLKECSTSMSNSEICRAITKISVKYLPEDARMWSVNNCKNSKIFMCVTGFRLIVVQKKLSEQFGFKTHNAIVKSIEPNSSAANKNLQIGDQIVTIDGQGVSNEEEIGGILPELGVNIVRLGVNRVKHIDVASQPIGSENKTKVKPAAKHTFQGVEGVINKNKHFIHTLLNFKRIDLTIGTGVAFGVVLCIYLLHSPTKLLNEPKILRERSKVTLKWTCLILASYMTLVLTSRYFENRDSTAIAYREYDDTDVDVYPTFTLCFTGTSLRWLNDHHIFDSYNLNATQYELMLKGETARRYEFDDTNATYRRKEVLMSDGDHLCFSLFSLQIQDILVKVEFSTEDSKKDVSFDNESPSEINTFPLKMNYQDVDRICFTRKTSTDFISIRSNDKVYFNRSLFSLYPNAKIDIFVHYPNQLIKVLNNPAFTTEFSGSGFSPSDPNLNQFLELRISQETILRKRKLVVPLRQQLKMTLSEL